MKPTSILNLLFLIFSLGMTSLNGATRHSYQSYKYASQLLTKEEMMAVQGSKFSWPFGSAGPFTVFMELSSVVGFGIYKKISNAIREKENRASEDTIRRQKEELMKEVQLLEKTINLKNDI